MNNEEGFSLKSLLLKVAFVIVFILLLLWFFPMPNMKPVYDRIFMDNIETMRDAAKSYYTVDRLPTRLGEKVVMSLEEMQNKKLVLPFTDSEGKLCDSRASYVEVTKTEREYLIKINLSCSTKADYIIEHFGCYDICSDLCEPTPVTEEPKKEVPKKEEPKKPIKVTYLYEYAKKFDAQYSAWTPWSQDIRYVDADNITFGCTELKCTEKTADSPRLEQVGQQIIYGTKLIEHETKVKVDEYTYQACKQFQYEVHSSGTYIVGQWVDQGLVPFKYPPSDTESEKYQFVKLDYTECDTSCSGKAYMIFRKWTRSVTKISGSGSVIVTCSEYETRKIPVYGPHIYTTSQREVLEVKKIYAYIKYYRFRTRTIAKEAYTDKKWSYYNDTKLLNNSYVYTGNKKIKN